MWAQAEDYGLWERRRCATTKKQCVDVTTNEWRKKCESPSNNVPKQCAEEGRHRVTMWTIGR